MKKRIVSGVLIAMFFVIDVNLGLKIGVLALCLYLAVCATVVQVVIEYRKTRNAGMHARRYVTITRSRRVTIMRRGRSCVGAKEEV